MESVSLNKISLGDIAILGLYVIAIIYVIYSFILLYHWREYSVESKVTKVTLVSYFGVTLPLLLAIALLTLEIKYAF